MRQLADDYSEGCTDLLELGTEHFIAEREARSEILANQPRESLCAS
jgi:hypothetical protein